MCVPGFPPRLVPLGNRPAAAAAAAACRLAGVRRAAAVFRLADARRVAAVFRLADARRPSAVFQPTGARRAAVVRLADARRAAAVVRLGDARRVAAVVRLADARRVAGVCRLADARRVACICRLASARTVPPPPSSVCRHDVTRIRHPAGSGTKDAPREAALPNALSGAIQSPLGSGCYAPSGAIQSRCSLFHYCAALYLAWGFMSACTVKQRARRVRAQVRAQHDGVMVVSTHRSTRGDGRLYRRRTCRAR